MKIFQFFKKNKYLMRIYFFAFIAFFLLVTMLSAAIYNKVESIIVEKENKNNGQLLSQLRYNLEFMDKTIKNLCSYLYFDDKSTYVMYNNDPDVVQTATIINNLKRSLSPTNPFVHSVYFYNKNNKTFYSTYKGMYYYDPILDEFLKQHEVIPQLKPIMRKIEPEYGRDSGYNYVFTYFMYEEFDKDSKEAIMVVNVKPEWLIENIMNIYSADRNNESNIFLFNNNGEYIGNKVDNKDFEKALKEAYNDYIVNAEENARFNKYMIKRIGGKDHMFSFLFIDGLDMLLVKTQEYSELSDFINRIRITIVTITVIVIILSLMVVFYTARIIYKPVGKLVNTVASENPKKDISGSKDEISYLSEVYKNIIEGINKYEIQRLSYKDEIKKQCLKKILYSAFSDTKEFCRELHENNIFVSIEKEMAICVVLIDNYDGFKNMYNYKDRNLLKFCIINIFEEVISRQFPVNGVDLDDTDKVVMIMNTNGAGSEFFSKIVTLIKEGQEHLKNYFNISLTVTISDIIANASEIWEKYDSALHNSSYRYVFGRGSIITPDMVEKNNANPQHGILPELKKKLEEEIRGGNLKKIESVLDKIISNIAGLSYNNIIVAVMVVFNIIKDTTDEINRMSFKPIRFNLASVSKNITEAETLDDFKIVVMDSLKYVLDLKQKNRVEEKHYVLVETIKDIIKKNYNRSNLYVDEIASILKMSPKYIGRIFKENTGMTISEYITDVRISIAADLLKNTELSVTDISLAVGIENDTYFYSLFKKKYGTTPKEYAVKFFTEKSETAIK